MTDSTRKDVTSPLVSIVIPTFNSEHTISPCLQSIQNQTYPNIEVLVVDNYSTDSTAEIAKKFGARTLLFKSERSAARNHGVANAEGPFILFLDSDMELTPKVVEECVTASLQTNADAVVIPEVPVAQNFLGECRKLEKEIYEYNNRFAQIPRFFKKETLLKVGGYDETLIFAESTEFNQRLEKADCKTVKIHAETKHNEGNLTWKKFILEEHYYGTKLPFLMKKNLSLVMQRHPPVPPSLFRIRNLKLLFKKPLHLVGLLFMELIKYIAFLTGFISYLLSYER